MLLNCGVGEDSWESLGLQGDPTSQSYRKSVLNLHWKDWCWALHTLLILWPPDVKNRLIGKDPDAGEVWRQEEKGMTEDEMVGWHHWGNGHVWVGSGNWWWTGKPGMLHSMRSQRVDTTDQLNWTEIVDPELSTTNIIVVGYILKIQRSREKLPIIQGFLLKNNFFF